MATTVLGQQFVETDDAFHPHQRIQLLAGVGEMFAQALVDADAAGSQLMLEHLLDQGRTTTTPGTGLGVTFELAQISAATVDGRADRALGDIVARADGGGFGQRRRAQGRGAFGRRQDQAGSVLGQGDAVLHVLQQGVVVAVIAHQHRADHALAVGGHHQSPVAGAGFVDELEAARPRGVAMGIADGANVHTQQLELGRHVGPGEGFRAFAAQPGRDVAGHLVARGDQAENAAVPGRAFADGVDVRVAALAMIVDHHATARTDLQVALASQGVLGTNAGGKHDEVGFQEIVVAEVHPITVLLTDADGLGALGQVHADAQLLDTGLEGQAALGIQLHRHQSGANSTTWASRPRVLRALAASRPSRPPPTTTPRRALLAAARIASKSSRVR